MGKPLKNPPVYFTVAQVRFNPVLKLMDFLPSIQEAFRQARYPDFAKHSAVLIKTNIEEGRVTPSLQQQEHYSFGNTAKTHSFLLDQSALTLQSTNYGTFEDFSEAFLRGVERVHEIVQLDFLERVGLRYLDHVSPLVDDTLDRYVVPEALGLSARLTGAVDYTFCETRMDQNGLKLLSRVVTQAGRLSFPPDMQPMGLNVDKRFLSRVGPHAILDNDGFFGAREEYSIDSVRKHLQDLHDVVKMAFRSIVTDYAFEVWDRDL